MRIHGLQWMDVSYVAPESLIGDSVTIALSQRPGDTAKWYLKLFVRTDLGRFFVAQWKTVDPATNAHAASYVVGGAVVPAARQWIVSARRVVETGDEKSSADLFIFSGRSGAPPSVTTMPIVDPADE